MNETHYPRVMVSGHRLLPEGSAPWVQQRIVAVVAQLNAKYGMRKAMSGMAIGVDQMFALAALGRDIEVDAYIPGHDQATRWSAAQQAAYEDLMTRASSVVSARTIHPNASYIARLHARNELMVNECNLAVLVLDDRQSGGAYSVKMKLSAAGKPTIHIDPKNRTVTASWPLQA